MKPSELYARPSTREVAWFDGLCELVADVLEIENIYIYDDYQDRTNADDGRFRVHQKFYHNVDGERGVGIYALVFDGKPFAYAMTGGRGGKDAQDYGVTDGETWHAARAYTLAALHRKVDPEVVPDEDVIHGFYSTFIADYDGEKRLVATRDVNPFSGTPVYDMEKFSATFDAVCRPLGKEIGYESGLEDTRMLEAALQAYRAGVLGERCDVNIERYQGNRLVAVSVIEGQTFAYTISTRGKYFSWARDIRPSCIGPASLAECFAEHAAGRDVDLDCAYVREASAAFGADPAGVHRELVDYISNGRSTLAERIVGLLPRHPDVPEAIVNGAAIFSLGHMVVADPSLTRFCEGGFPWPDKAKELVDHCTKIREQEAATLSP